MANQNSHYFLFKKDNSCLPGMWVGYCFEKGRMMLEVVYAHYNEPLDWMRIVPANVNICYYDKLERVDITAFGDAYRRFVFLRNVGRENHTFIEHILSYSLPSCSLSDKTLFLHGDFYNHFDKSELTPIFLGNDSTVFKQYDRRGQMQCDKKGFPQHIAPSKLENGVLPIERVWNELFKAPCPEIINFVPGCTFHVKRERIEFRSREFWKRCLHMLDYDVDPVEGYVFERLWGYILDGKTEAII